MHSSVQEYERESLRGCEWVRKCIYTVFTMHIHDLNLVTRTSRSHECELEIDNCMKSTTSNRFNFKEEVFSRSLSRIPTTDSGSSDTDSLQYIGGRKIIIITKQQKTLFKNTDLQKNCEDLDSLCHWADPCE